MARDRETPYFTWTAERPWALLAHIRLIKSTARTYEGSTVYFQYHSATVAAVYLGSSDWVEYMEKKQEMALTPSFDKLGRETREFVIRSEGRRTWTGVKYRRRRHRKMADVDGGKDGGRAWMVWNQGGKGHRRRMRG